MVTKKINNLSKMPYWVIDGLIFKSQSDALTYRIDYDSNGQLIQFRTEAEAESYISGTVQPIQAKRGQNRINDRSHTNTIMD